MKKSIIAGLIVLVLIGATSVWPRKATAETGIVDKMRAISQASQAKSQPWVVVLQGQWDYPENTFSVSVLSASAGAPKIHIGDDLAEALALLRTANGQVTINGQGYLAYTVQSQ